MNLHHLGIATDNIEFAEEFIRYSHTILDAKGPIWDENLKATVLILKTKEGTSLELVKGPAVAPLIKRGINLYHICYEVNSLANTIKELENAGGKVIVEPTPAILFDNRKVSFLMTPLGIIELLQAS